MIYRTAEEEIIKSIKSRPVTLVTGARQVGKSTLCYEMKKRFGYSYVSLDDLRNRKEAIEDPEMFLQVHKPPLIIDEIQYAPKLFEVIEAIVNKEKLEKGSNAGMYIITGSQAFELMKGVSESMAGRVNIIKLPPLSVREIFACKNPAFDFSLESAFNRSADYDLDANSLLSLIVKGMYPELYADGSLDAEKFYSDYVSTYLERDVSSILNVKDKLKFQNFMEILASLTGEELIVDNIAKAIGVKSDTIKSWISVLVSSDIVYLLEPYNEFSVVKRVVKRPKIYFADTGLAAYLSKLSNPSVLGNSIFKGRFIETYIVNELRKSYLNNGKAANFYYYRDSNQNEIDLLVLAGGEMHFVECMSGVSFSSKDVRGFKKLEESNYKIGTSYIICNTPTIYKVKENVYALPITVL